MINTIVFTVCIICTIISCYIAAGLIFVSDDKINPVVTRILTRMLEKNYDKELYDQNMKKLARDRVFFWPKYLKERK